jgi:hypothetical protein
VEVYSSGICDVLEAHDHIWTGNEIKQDAREAQRTGAYHTSEAAWRVESFIDAMECSAWDWTYGLQQHVTRRNPQGLVENCRVIDFTIDQYSTAPTTEQSVVAQVDFTFNMHFCH